MLISRFGVLVFLIVIFLFEGCASFNNDSTDLFIPEDGLIAYWSFNDRTSLDNSGNGHDGVKHGTTSTDGIVGPALKFNGETDYIQIPHDPAFNMQAKTIQFWFKKDNITIDDTPYKDDMEGIFWKSFDTGLNRAFSFSIANQSPPFSYYLKVGNDSNSLITAITEHTIIPFEWYHAVSIIDSNKISIYLNGELVDSVSNEGIIIHNSAPIIIGKAAVVSPKTRYFEGTIDEIRIYNRVLSDFEIQSLYAQGADHT
jgi:Concanavalin A-like lectin/glucanases superfamily